MNSSHAVAGDQDRGEGRNTNVPTNNLSQRVKIRVPLVAVLVLLCSCFLTAAAKDVPPGSLQVYFADVEGGQSTLFVTPAGESLLIDTGWPGPPERGVNRIIALTKLAGIKRIDYVIITHFHVDHVGGVPELLKQIPVGTFVDHGVNRETSDMPTQMAFAAYEQALQQYHSTRIHAVPGMQLPFHGMNVTFLSADGEVISTPLPGAGAKNDACTADQIRPTDQTENARSAGVLITFDKTRILDLGDLTWDKEQTLMCPINRIGKVDVYVVSHHGWNMSGSPAFLDGIAPRLAIMDNGANKGGTASTWDIIEHSPRLEDLWQLHHADQNDAGHNVADSRIANLVSRDADQGNYLRLTVAPDGTLAVFNSRTNQEKSYPPK